MDAGVELPATQEGAVAASTTIAVVQAADALAATM